MHTFSWATWCLAACVGAVDALASNTSGTVEVDLVFPQNETYAPSPLFPIIFAFQNAELAPSVGFRIRFEVRDYINWDPLKRWIIFSHEYDMRWANFSSHEPYFEYEPFLDFQTEGTWWLIWEVFWGSCIEGAKKSDGLDGVIFNSTDRKDMIFTTKKTAPGIDLVAATTAENCAENWGHTIDIAHGQDVPYDVEWFPSATCGVMASTTPKPNPCGARINSAIASSISSSMTSSVCGSASTNIPVPCPPKKSAAPRLHLGGSASLLAAFGVLLCLFH